jgi:hypothetical protein
MKETYIIRYYKCWRYNEAVPTNESKAKYEDWDDYRGLLRRLTNKANLARRYENLSPNILIDYPRTFIEFMPQELRHELVQFVMGSSSNSLLRLYTMPDRILGNARERFVDEMDLRCYEMVIDSAKESASQNDIGSLIFFSINILRRFANKFHKHLHTHIARIGCGLVSVRIHVVQKYIAPNGILFIEERPINGLIWRDALIPYYREWSTRQKMMFGNLEQHHTCYCHRFQYVDNQRSRIDEDTVNAKCAHCYRYVITDIPVLTPHTYLEVRDRLLGSFLVPLDTDDIVSPLTQPGSHVNDVDDTSLIEEFECKSCGAKHDARVGTKHRIIDHIYYF